MPTIAIKVLASGDDARNINGDGTFSATAVTQHIGMFNATDDSGLVLPENKGGWFETADNTLLNLELGGAVQVSGALTYIEV
jgi:hypothetical protein